MDVTEHTDDGPRLTLLGQAARFSCSHPFHPSNPFDPYIHCYHSNRAASWTFAIVARSGTNKWDTDNTDQTDETDQDSDAAGLWLIAPAYNRDCSVTGR
mgnify:CR=1